MAVIIEDHLHELRQLVREVLARDVSDHGLAREHGTAALQERRRDVIGVGALDAASAVDAGGLGLGAAAVAAEAARFSGSLGWTLVPSLLLRALGEDVDADRIGMATRLTGTVPAADSSGRLEGVAAVVLDGAEADAILIVGGGAVVIAPRTAVAAVNRIHSYEGLRGAEHAELVFDGAGRVLATTTSDAESALRILAGAVAVGIGEAAVASARNYQRQRIQFGRPIAEYGEMRAMLADGAERVMTARQAVLGAARVGVARPASTAGAAAAFLAASGAAVRAAEMAQHSHGGYGHMTEFAVHTLVRDARMIAVCAGSHPELDEAVLTGIDQI